MNSTKAFLRRSRELIVVLCLMLGIGWVGAQGDFVLYQKGVSPPNQPEFGYSGGGLCSYAFAHLMIDNSGDSYLEFGSGFPYPKIPKNAARDGPLTVQPINFPVVCRKIDLQWSEPLEKDTPSRYPKGVD